MTKLNRINTWFTVVIAIAGLALLGVGVPLENDLLIALGSAVLGAGVGLILGRLANQDTIDDMISIVKESQRHGFVSDDGELDSWRRPLHLYHMTVQNGQAFWAYRPVDFSKNRAVGKLVGNLNVRNANEDHNYHLEIGRVGERMICLVERADDVDEQCAIFLYPHMGAIKLEGCSAGFLWHVTWETNEPCWKEGMSKALVAYEPIADIPIGRVSEDGGQRLDAIWKRLFTMRFFLLPNTGMLTPPDARGS